MNTDERVIDVTDLRRMYGGGFEAVQGISFTVGRGELFALLGTNGAGKTSTVEVLEGLAKPTGGRVRVLGHDPHLERGAVRPRIGVMLQEGGFPSELTVTETLRMWAGCTSNARPIAREQNTGDSDGRDARQVSKRARKQQRQGRKQDSKETVA